MPDPFVGSGTALRVCQQLNRNCIGIDINNEYINIAKGRLSQEFNGFDSIDVRMLRVPNDLNDDKIRSEYLKNHVKWFLQNHKNEITSFENDVNLKYGNKNLLANNLKIF